jgi:hypothetical protein
MAPSTRTVSTCLEKQRLSKAFVDAVHEVMALQTNEMQMLAHRGAGLERFELALGVARRKRDQAKRAYNRHMEEHGC